MLVAKVHRDRAKLEQTAGAGPHPHPHPHPKKLRDKKANDATKGGDGALSGDGVDDFRAKRDAAAATSSPPSHTSSVGLGDVRRKRSSVVAMVKKRVEMLHMNAVSREFTQVLVSRCLIFCFRFFFFLLSEVFLHSTRA